MDEDFGNLYFKTVKDLKYIIARYNLSTHIPLSRNGKALKKAELIHELKKHIVYDNENEKWRIIHKEADSTVKSYNRLKDEGFKIPKHVKKYYDEKRSERLELAQFFQEMV